MSARIALGNPPFSRSIQEQIDRITPPGIEPLFLFRALARDERLFSRFIGGALLDPGHLTVREREIVIHRICALNHAEYEWGIHAAIFAPRAEFTPEELAATVHGNAMTPCWTPRESLLIQFCDELNKNYDIEDSMWNEIISYFSELMIIELIMLVGFYKTVSQLTNCLRLPLEKFAARFPEATYCEKV